MLNSDSIAQRRSRSNWFPNFQNRWKISWRLLLCEKIPYFSSGIWESSCARQGCMSSTLIPSQSLCSIFFNPAIPIFINHLLWFWSNLLSTLYWTQKQSSQPITTLSMLLMYRCFSREIIWLMVFLIWRWFLQTIGMTHIRLWCLSNRSLPSFLPSSVHGLRFNLVWFSYRSIQSSSADYHAVIWYENGKGCVQSKCSCYCSMYR